MIGLNRIVLCGLQMILYIFLDESGNFDFHERPGATEWLILTSLSTTDPEEGLIEYYRVRHELIDAGHDIACFHATEDLQEIRNQFFPVIAGLKKARVDGIAVAKRYLYPPWREMNQFYPRMMAYLLRYVFDPKGMDVAKFDKILIFLAKMTLPKGHRKALLSGIKHYLRHDINDVPFRILLHSSQSHPYLQMVDYCSWALYVNHDKSETRPLNEIRHIVHSDFDIFQHGQKRWY
jgi:hypothetical protein